MAKKVVKQIEDKSKLYEVVLEDVMHTSMLPYSEGVILDRALPRVEDGLKPVQRRILYSMSEMGLTPEKPYKKSARIVGDCMGKYHPHGDGSVYGAMVRMAQSFSLRMPLVDGHGNFGSVDGDSAAAMRYTEARMNQLAMQLLRDLEKETVDWVANFDDSLQEPVVLPGRFPNLFVNGADGIAVGLATKIPPHNLGELIDATVAMIENPRIKLADLLQIVKGPDFPTCAMIVPVDTMETIYENGKGKIKIRSKVHIEDDINGKKNIVITEIPYQVSKADLLTKIAKLREVNKEKLGCISDIIDESDKNGTRAVIKLKKGSNAQSIVDFLMKKTNLEISYSINIVAIANGKPEQLGLVQYLKYYVAYQRDIIKKRTQYDLKIAKNRYEIVKGLIVAIKNIDEVIKIIKSSKNTTEAKQKLKQRFDLSEVQAQAIVDMRLKSLTHLEIEKLQIELDELEKKIAYLSAILASKTRQLTIVKKEILEIKNANKNLIGRQTTISNDENIKLQTKEDMIEYRDGVLVKSSDGGLKFLTTRAFKAGSSKEEQEIENLAEIALGANNNGHVYAFTNLGKIMKLDIDLLPNQKWKDKSIKLCELSPEIQTNEYPIKLMFFREKPTGELVFFTKKGMAKRSSWEQYMQMKTVAEALVLNDDELINVETIKENSKQNVLTVSKLGMSLQYSVDQIPIQGRKAGGVRSIKLADDDKIEFAGISDDEGEVAVITEKGFSKRVIIPTLDVSNRYNKGVKIVELGAKDKIIFANIIKMPYNIALLCKDKYKAINTEKIAIDTRTTKGKQLSKTKIDGVIIFKTTKE